MRGIFQATALVCVQACALWALDPSLQLSQYHKQSWQVEQGLPHDYVTAICQAADGYLLVGTDEGLAKFDGVDFRPLPAAPSMRLSTRWISALLRARDSSLWVGTFDGLLLHWRDSRVVRSFKVGGSIFDLLQDSNGAIWASTRNGVLRIDGGKLQRLPKLGPPLETSWNVFSAGSDGTMWVVTAAGLFKVFPGGISRKLFDGLKYGPTLSVLACRKGALWLGTTRGLFRLSSGEDVRPVRISGVNGPVVTLLEDREGVIWVGTWGQGLYRVTKNGVDHWPSQEGLPDAFVRTLAEDAEGDLWIGTRSGGLVQWKDPWIIPFGPPEGLAGSYASVVAADPAGYLWLGTWRGGLYRLKGDKLETQPTPRPTLYFTVRALAFDLHGYPWIGNWEGLYQFDGSRYRHFAGEPDTPYRRVSALLFDRHGGLWVGTTEHGLFRFPGGTPTNSRPEPLLAGSGITALLEDSEGRIWVGTSNGLGRFSDESAATFEAIKQLPAAAVESISEDSGKRIWAATAEGSLFVVSRSRYIVLDRNNGLPGYPLYRVLEAADGAYWISSGKGILELPAESVEEVLHGQGKALDVRTYGQNDGMRSIECHGLSQPAGWRSRDGGLWFPTAMGFVKVRAATTRSLPPPRPEIEGIRADSQSLAQAHEVNLHAGARNVEIAYTALRLSNPREVVFRYRLKGYDPDWVYAGLQRTAHYNQLPPGIHMFEVEARDPSGPWGIPASLSFRQRPRFRQTPWFLLSLGAAGCAVIWGMYRWRLHGIRGRYAAVLEERNRIGREWHDTLVAGFSAISLQLEAAAAHLKDRPEHASEILAVTRKMVHHYRAEARRVIWDLRDSRPDSETLPDALRSALENAKANEAIGGTVTVTGQPAELSADVQHNVLRICQEAMSNAARHGRPSQIDIELVFADHEVTATVRDDGCGFALCAPEAERAGHFGITVMQERARRLGGTLTIRSGPENGTTVKVTIPMLRGQTG